MLLKSRIIAFWAALYVLPLFLVAQTKADAVLSDRDQKKFDTHFYEAQRYKQTERHDAAIANFRACYKINPKDATVAFELGKLIFTYQSQEEGVRFLEMAHSLAPSNKWMTLELAGKYRSIGRTKEATALFEALTEAYPGAVKYKFDLAQLYFAQNKYKACLKTLNEIEAFTGVNAELINQKKDIYLLMNDAKGAQLEMQKLVNAYPDNLDYRGALARFYLANEDVNEALHVYKEMILIAPNDPRAHLDLANIYQQMGKYDSSYVHLKVAMANPQLEIDPKIQVLYSFYKAGERDSIMHQMGLELLDVSISATPKEPKLFAMRADYYMRDDKPNQARNDLRKASRLGANQLQIWSQILLLDARLELNDSLAADGAICAELYPNQPLGYLMAGSGNALTGKHEVAIGYLEMGLDYVIDNPELEEQFYISLADAHHNLEQHRESDAYFEKALAINPRNPSTLNNYAFYLATRGVQLDKALEMTQRCNTLSPQNGIFLDTWAWVLFQKGDYTKALEKIEEALKNGGYKNGEVMEHYGDIRFKLGEIDHAVAIWEKAAALPGASARIKEKIAKRAL